MEKTSLISGFYKLPLEDRLRMVSGFAGLTEEESALLKAEGSLPLHLAERMIENVVGFMPLPLGIAVNFLVNGKPYMVPMALEEPSVVAAASHAAKMAAVRGGFQAETSDPIMIGQIQVVNVKEPFKASRRILAEKEAVLDLANSVDPVLVKLGGGAKGLEVKILSSFRGPMLVVELYVDCRDAMGANAVNSMAEAVAPLVERLAEGRIRLRIISNLADRRLARASVVMDRETVGEDVVEGVLDAYAFAVSDPYRAATHNKGIMNGIVAVALATGNDTRALEAGAHTYAARSGRYQPLTRWEKDGEGNLVGSIELPIAVGVVGGATASHPIAQICRKILGVKTARELAEVMAAVGLAQNFAALRALATEGIQRGHMELHARNVAIMAGAKGELIDLVAEKMVEERKIRLDRAQEILEETRKEKPKIGA
ncbi:TPA: hydroxymethylglutaryl-CoA reductase, degradative [Candidatus Bathyarchaeota archaeon]|nr:hydroxymethylglutaryl-CoA reductase, degradative [Candidatus Bathyarchaeota archaeon]